MLGLREDVAEEPVVRDLVRQLGPRAEETLMTGAEILRAEGRAEGEARGRAEVLLKLLELKFGQVPASVAQRVNGAALQEIDRWVERV